MNAFFTNLAVILLKFTFIASANEEAEDQKYQEVKSRFMQKYYEDVVEGQQIPHEKNNNLRRNLSPKATTSSYSSWDDDCDEVVRVPFYTNNTIFNEGFTNTSVGWYVDDVDIFSQDDDSVVGFLTLVATIFGERNFIDRGTNGCYEDGYISTTDSEGNIIGTVYYAGAGGDFQEDFPITGGTGAYARATGIMERQGNTPDFSQFFFELIICLP